jgi:hypothetical protein
MQGALKTFPHLLSYPCGHKIFLITFLVTITTFRTSFLNYMVTKNLFTKSFLIKWLLKNSSSSLSITIWHQIYLSPLLLITMWLLDPIIISSSKHGVTKIFSLSHFMTTWSPKIFQLSLCLNHMTAPYCTAPTLQFVQSCLYLPLPTNCQNYIKASETLPGTPALKMATAIFAETQKLQHST